MFSMKNAMKLNLYFSRKSDLRVSRIGDIFDRFTHFVDRWFENLEYNTNYKANYKYFIKESSMIEH
jgi:hypothetical protein